MLKLYVIFVFTLTITFTIKTAAEEETENRAQNSYQVFGDSDSPQTYYFGYDSKEKDAPRLMREETRLPDGTVTGRYGYTDPFGVFRVVKYVSGNNGYYATEEIGERVTSTTPQYYKATAPQVESVSEEPISYSIDLPTKFNPPLYHPEAHTMAPDYQRQPSDQLNNERTEDQSGNSGVDSNNNHQIFSLSNSEDILEKKYRERKELEKTLRGSQNQNQNRVNVVVKQTVSKRVGLLPVTNYEQPIPLPITEFYENKRQLNDFSNENNDNIKPFINPNNGSQNEFFKREPEEYERKNESKIITDNRYDSRNKNFQNIQINERNNNFNINEKNIKITFTESPITTTSLPIETRAESFEDNIPDNLKHLYYSPTRTPTFSYSTSVSKPIEVKNPSNDKIQTNLENNENNQKDDVWIKIRELFRNGSPSTTTETVPTTTTDVPITTTPSVEINRKNITENKIFIPILVRNDSENYRSFPKERDEPNSRYPARNIFAERLNRRVVFTPIRIESEKVLNNQNFSDFTTDVNTNYLNNNTENTEFSFKTDHIQDDLALIDSRVASANTFGPTTESTTVTERYEPIELNTESLRISSENIDKEKQNESIDSTKSAFFHDFLLNPVHSPDHKYSEEPEFEILLPEKQSHSIEDNQTLQNTSVSDYSRLQNTDHSNITEIPESTTESATHPTNEKFLEDFWNNFNEQTILFSEALVDNQTKAQNNSNPVINETMDWISEQIDKKSIMFSEAKVDKPNTQTTESFTTTTTETPAISEKTTETFTLQTTSDRFTETPSETTPQITTEMTTEISTEIPSTTMTTPNITTTELVNKEFLNNFWHNFNDNSDEYFDSIFEKMSNNQTETTEHNLISNETTSETQFNKTLEKNMTEIENNFTKTENQDLDSMEDTNHSLNITTFEAKVLPTVHSSDQQNIPPLSALFEFPHMRKRIRRVQRLRNLPNTSPEEPTITTEFPIEVEADIMSTDATEELTAISGSDDDNLRLISSQRVYRYIPPYPVLKQSFIIKESNPIRLTNGIPVQYSQAFDDMSEIVTTIRSMRKLKRHQNEGTTPKSTENVVRFDDNPDSDVSILPQKSFSNDNTRSQMRYFLPIEPQRDTQNIRQLSEVLEINRNKNNFRSVHKYEPIIRFEA